MKTITEIINEAWLAGYKEGYKTNFQKPEEAKKNMANNYTTEVVNKNDLLPDVSNPVCPINDRIRQYKCIYRGDKCRVCLDE